MPPPWRVLPGAGIGPFRLGLRLPEVLAILDADDERRRRTSRGARPPQERLLPHRLLHHDGDSLKYDLVLDVPSRGMQLRFDPVSQRLWVVDCYDLRRVALSYRAPGGISGGGGGGGALGGGLGGDGARTAGGGRGGEVFSGATALPSFAKVLKLFGPTFPGGFDESLGAYPLVYRGVTFFFPLPAPFRGLYTRETAKMPLQLPDGSELAAQRAIVYAGASVHAPELPMALRADDVYVTLAFQLNEDKTCCTDFALKMDRSGRTIRMNDPVQRVLSELGSPSGVYEKTSDQMRIHGSSRGGDGVGGGGGGVDGGDVISAAATRAGAEADVRRGVVSSLAFGGDSSGGGGFGGGLSGGGGKVGLAASAVSLHRANCAGYFFNYHRLGIDILFDGARHTVQKIICHGNFPGHADFGAYQRCHFRLLARTSARSGGDVDQQGGEVRAEAGEEETKTKTKKHGKKKGAARAQNKKAARGGNNNSTHSRRVKHKASSTSAAASGEPRRTTSAEGNAGGNHGAPTSSSSSSNSAVIASLRSSWKRARPVIERCVGTPSGPMVCAGYSGLEDAYTFAGQAVAPCPYAPSLLFAVPGCIFEVLEGSGHIATLTVFSE